MRDPTPRGFTLIEAMVTVAIMAALSAAAIFLTGLGRERASIATEAADLQALIHQARQTALSEGTDVAVMFFPTFPNPLGGVGRVVVYQDPNGNHFTGSPSPFSSYNATTTPAASGDALIEVYDLPRLIDFGLVSTAALPAPFASIPVSSACSFCGSTRGAIRFDPRGRASFYSGDAPPLQVVGGSVTLAMRALDGFRPATEVRTIAIASTTGAVRTFVR